MKVASHKPQAAGAVAQHPRVAQSLLAPPEPPAAEFGPRANRQLGRTNSFDSKPAVPAVARRQANATFGAVRAGGNPAAQLSAIADLRGGASAGPDRGTLSIRNGEVQAGATRARTPQALERSLARRPMSELQGQIGSLSDPERAALGKAIAAGKVTDPRVVATFIQLQPPADRAQSMQKLSPKQLDQMKALMRAGECPNDVAVGVGLRMAAASDWGKANPAVVKTMQKAYGESMMRIAQADSDIAGLGMTSASGIDLSNQLRKSPEAMAATLAHEGVHLHSGSGCCSGGDDATPAGEVAGMSASAEVWGQLGKKDDTDLTPASLKLLNEADIAKKGGQKPFKDKVLGWYTGFYQAKRDKLAPSVDRQNKAYEASQKPGGKALSPDRREKLEAARAKLAYLEKTIEAFQVAWKANG